MPESASEVAARLGFTYSARSSRVDEYRHLPEIIRGSKITHLIEGRLGDRPLAIFQSSYLVYAGQGFFPVYHTVYSTAAPPWPLLHVEPRSWWARLAVRWGRSSGLMLESARFNTLLRVRTDDDDFAITLLGPAMQAFMLEKMGVSWHLGSSQACLVYRGALRPARLESSLNRLDRFWGLVAAELLDW